MVYQPHRSTTPISMKRKQRQNHRGSCENCKAAKRNPTGHVQKSCAFAGGPFEERGFKAAIPAARAEAKRQRSNKAARTGGSTSLPAEATTQLHTSIRDVRESTTEVDHQADLRKEVNEGIDNVAHYLGRIMKLEKQVAAQTATITRIESFLQNLLL